MSLLALILTILPLAVPVQEKQGAWFGSASLEAGTNFKTSNVFDMKAEDFIPKLTYFTNSGGLSVGYKAPKFQFSASWNGSYNYHHTSVNASSYKIGEEEINLGADMTQTVTRTQSHNLGLNLSYLPTPADRLSFSYNQIFASDNPANTTISLIVAFVGDSRLQASNESSTNSRNTYRPSFGWHHDFGAGRFTDFSANWNYVVDNRYTVWNYAKVTDLELDEDFDIVDGDAVEKQWRVTPKYLDSDFDFTLRYSDPMLADVKNLSLDAFLDAKIGRDIDHYEAANYVEEEWRDSLSYRADFDYLATTVEPRADLKYKYGTFDFRAVAALQIFADRLNSGKNVERYTIDRVDPICQLYVSDKIGKYHTLSLTGSRNIQRPSYLQLCWFNRPMVLSNELQGGNPNLRPTAINTASLTYNFSYKRLGFSVGAQYDYVRDKIERTFSNMAIDGAEFRVYTYINAGTTHTTSLSSAFHWNGERLKFNISERLNYVDMKSGSGKWSDDWNYNINGDISYNWKFGLSALARTRYTSRKSDMYSTTSDYIGCDVRINQKFKKFNLYFEGRDLFDETIEYSVTSEDFMESRTQESELNRRLFLLGVSVSF